MGRHAAFFNVIATIALIPAALGQTTGAVTEAPLAWTVTPAIASQYMFRGVRLGGMSFQPAVEAAEKNVAVGVWANVPLEARVPGQSDPEIDLYGSDRVVLSDALSLQPGFTWYTYANAERRNGFYRTTFEPNFAVNYVVQGVTLTPKVYYDLVLEGPTFELNGSYALPLKNIGTEVDFNASAGTYQWKKALADQDPAVKGWGDYWLLGATMPYQITRTSKVMLGFAYTRGSGNYFKQGVAPKTSNTAAVGRGVVTLSYAVTF